MLCYTETRADVFSLHFARCLSLQLLLQQNPVRAAHQPDCSVRAVPFPLKKRKNLFSGNWPVEQVYWAWTSPYLKAFPTGCHQPIYLKAVLGDCFILCLSLVWKGFSRKIPHNQFSVTRHTLSEIFHVFYLSTPPSFIRSLSFHSVSLGDYLTPFSELWTPKKKLQKWRILHLQHEDIDQVSKPETPTKIKSRIQLIKLLPS